jgi:glutamyl-tRNA synthetase
MQPCVRFAPSPTGHVHIGNMRAAIFNWLFARHTGGRFLLRMEDTDRERSTPEAVRTVLDALEWLGLDPDAEPLYQSTRRTAHCEAAEALLASGAAYREDKGGTGRGECVVFRMPEAPMMFHDEIKGPLRKEAADMRDFVIVRSDGSPVFHLANVVDDIHMGITHVIRGDDHIENTYRHVALYAALGAPVPRFAHLPMIVNAQGKPYSKRDGDAYVGDFRARGFLPEALFNYLSLLGWSPGDDREKLSRDALVRLFTLDRVKSAPAQMDLKKLTHLNAEYVAELPADVFARAAHRAVRDTAWGAAIADDAYFRAVCALMQTRTHVLTMTADWAYFFSEAFPVDPKALRKAFDKEGVREAVTTLRALLEAERAAGAGEPGEEHYDRAIRAAERRHGVAEGKLNQAVRAVVTGLPRGAGLYETMALLGLERVVQRLGRAPSL